MSAPNKRQLAIHSDKWVVTVREAKDLTRGQQRDSFFTKMSPVCELSLGDQGPFSTSVKPNTTQPSWDESLEFEAYPSPPAALSTVPSSSPSRSSAAVEGKIGEEGEEDDGAGGLPPAGPKLGVVCYTRGVNATGAGAGAEGGGGAEGGAGRGQRGRSIREKVEIGRAEVTLSVEGTEVLKKVRVTLHRRNAVGSQIPAGSVGVEYMLVPGIPPLPDTPPAEEQRPPPAAVVSGADVPAFVVERPRPSALEAYSDNRRRKGLGRKPVLFLAAAAVAAIAALLATRLASLDDLGLALGLSAPMPPLSPIPVPFKFAAGKYKGSITHHIRLQEDGNIVVATGPKPPPPLPPPPTSTGGKPAATATLLWQSGPIRSLERSEDPSKRTCKKCQLRVGRDGRVVVARGKEELAVFSPSSVRKLKAFLLLGDGN